jgi:transaldolase
MGDQVRPNYAEAQATMDSLADAGIDYDDVIAVLIREGVEKFVTSWSDLAETVRGSLEQARA